nr:MAG TPA: hypothetical protein [Inoviridae sp.]
MKFLKHLLFISIGFSIGYFTGFIQGESKAIECLKTQKTTELNLYCLFSSPNVEFIELDKLEEINLQNKEQTLK